MEKLKLQDTWFFQEYHPNFWKNVDNLMKIKSTSKMAQFRDINKKLSEKITIPSQIYTEFL